MSSPTIALPLHPVLCALLESSGSEHRTGRTLKEGEVAMLMDLLDLQCAMAEDAIVLGSTRPPL